MNFASHVAGFGGSFRVYELNVGNWSLEMHNCLGCWVVKAEQGIGRWHTDPFGCQLISVYGISTEMLQSARHRSIMSFGLSCLGQISGFRFTTAMANRWNPRRSHHPGQKSASAARQQHDVIVLWRRRKLALGTSGQSQSSQRANGRPQSQEAFSRHGDVSRARVEFERPKTKRVQIPVSKKRLSVGFSNGYL